MISLSEGLRLRITPHPKAKILTHEKDIPLLIQHLISEISSKSLQTANNHLRELLRALGYANLWFFIKFICGFAGEFDRLNPSLHVEVCNFYQDNALPGARAFVFLPRGHCKSKIFTEGGTAWDILRDPNITIKIFNAIAAKSSEFLHTVQRIYDSNELFAWLYPEYVPEKNARRWNELEMVLPNRSKKAKREPTVTSGGVGGASEGGHFDIVKVDDMFGLKALNSALTSAAEMEKAKNWFKTSISSLLNSPIRSRVIGAGTRYAVDDGYDDVLKNVRGFSGSTPYGYKEKDTGAWNVYFRSAIENGEVIFPEDFSLAFYEDLKETDLWSYQTQYMNNPQHSGMTELSEYTVHGCDVEYSDARGWEIFVKDADRKEKRIDLAQCDTLQAGDPAASEKGLSSRTSRSALIVLAQDWEGNKYILDISADFVKVQVFLEWFFKKYQKFKGYLRCSCIETQGAFKLLGPLLRDMQRDKNMYIGLKTVNKTGEKNAVIRSVLQPELANGKLYCSRHCRHLLDEELNNFPMSNKKDILDALSLGVQSLHKPESAEERDRQREYEENYFASIHNIAGY